MDEREEGKIHPAKDIHGKTSFKGKFLQEPVTVRLSIFLLSLTLFGPGRPPKVASPRVPFGLPPRP